MSFWSKLNNFFKLTGDIANNIKDLELQFGGISDISSKYFEIDTKDDILTIYKTIPTIRAIIDKKAQMFTKVDIKEFKKDKELENTPFLNVIANPHPLYSENEFLETLAKQLYLFDEVFIYVNRTYINSYLKENDTFLILPANDVTANYQENINIKEIKSVSDYLINYTFDFQGKKIQFLPDEIIRISRTALKNITEVDLTMKSIEEDCNVLASSSNVVTTLYRRNGGFGILTNQNKSDGASMMNPNIEKSEIESLQNEFKRYSFSKRDFNMIISNANLKYQPISFPISSMEIPQNVKNAKANICDVLNFSILTLNSLEGATFNNKEIADKENYTNAIIPDWQLIEKSFNRQKLTPNKIVFDYTEIQNLITDKKTQIETNQLYDNQIINRFEKGLITKNEMLIALNLEPITGGDVYFSAPKQNTNENL